MEKLEKDIKAMMDVLRRHMSQVYQEGDKELADVLSGVELPLIRTLQIIGERRS